MSPTLKLLTNGCGRALSCLGILVRKPRAPNCTFSSFYRSTLCHTASMSSCKNETATKSSNVVNAYVTRSHTCEELRSRHIGERVTLCGWIQFSRYDMFLTLRDAYGVTQLVVSDDQEKVNYAWVFALPFESVIKVIGEVRSRPEKDKNLKMPTGEIEVTMKEVELLSEARSQLPFEVRDFYKVKEGLRMEYRYLDLRTAKMQFNLRFRSHFIRKMREYLYKQGFVDVDTPCLFKRTPGGASEFIVPTREKGKFYSLPQSPQQFKQMLMVGGLDKYFQIAKCFRDEGSLPDRQPEFTQLDVEMSFTSGSGVRQLVEDVLRHAWPPYPLVNIHHTQSPPLTSSHTPHTSSHTPLTSSHTPHTSSHTPHTSSHTPHTSSPTPHTSSHTPHTSSPTPHTSSHTPHTSSHTPHTSSHTPLTSSHTPLTSSHTPLTSSHTPLTSSHTPHTSSHTPHTSSHTPHTSSHTPLTSSHTPHTSSHTPHTSSHTPLTSSHTPHTSSHTPHTSSHTPHTSSHTPLTSSPTPHTSSHTPHTSSHTPHTSSHTPLTSSHTPHTSSHTPLTSSSTLQTPFHHLTYEEAMETYGSDKPDTRFDMKLVDVTDVMREVPVTSVQSMLQSDSDNSQHTTQVTCKCITLDKNKVITSRSKLQSLVEKFLAEPLQSDKQIFYSVEVQHVSSEGAGALRGIDLLPSGIAKHIGASHRQQMISRAGLQPGSIALLMMGAREHVNETLGKVRLHLADMLESNGIPVRDPGKVYEFVWVTDFPLFIRNQNGDVESAHHPFTAPIPEHEHLLYTDPLKVTGQHYDLVLNGIEIGGGSIRVHDAKVQRYILKDILQEDPEQLSHLLMALECGCPPHGGIALGLDRLLSIITGSRNIRDMIAFPKSADSRDLLSGSPCPVSDHVLRDYHIHVARS